MNAWLVGVVLLSGIVLGVLGAILSGKARVPRWARVLIVLALVLFGLLAIGDLIGGLLGYSNIYSSVRDTGYFENGYLTKMAALVLAFSFYLTLGFAGRFFWHLKWQKSVSCLIAWLFLYFGAMAIMTNGQIFSNDGPEKSYVRLPATEQFPKGEILLMDKNLKQDRYYGIEGKKPDPEIMKEYYGQHPDKRPGEGTGERITPSLPPRSLQPMKEIGNPTQTPSISQGQQVRRFQNNDEDKPGMSAVLGVLLIFLYYVALLTLIIGSVWFAAWIIIKTIRNWHL
jgi:hypothetical protein